MLIDEIEREIAGPREAAEDSESDVPEIDLGSVEISDDCEIGEFPPELQWLNRPAVIERVQTSCKHLKRDGGIEAFGRDLLGNVPTMMFCFLPILALVMKLLYAGSRRYYVEHLLFFVHYHSYFYLAAAFVIGFARVPDAVFPGQGVISGFMIAALVFYTPYYLFRSMRVVYGQHWLVTFIKFIALNVAYFAGLIITFALTALITALLV